MTRSTSLSGAIFGERYKVVHKLGEGATSEVYLVEHAHIGRREAVNVLKPEVALEPAFVQRFRREARAINRVQHQNIIGIYDFGMLPDGRLYLAMEYADGPSCEHLLRDGGRFNTPRALRVLHQLANAIGHAHRHHVVHRDLKPGNMVLVEHRGQHDVLKVLDFGMAKIVGLEGDNLTRRGEVFGTPEYMAPELLDATTTDPRSDIYAVGCIAYELATGQPPFSGNHIQMIHAHMEQTPVPPKDREPLIPPTLDSIIMQCLAKDPDDRFQTGEQLSSALRQVVGFPGRNDGVRTGKLWIPAVPATGAWPVEVHEDNTSSESTQSGLQRIHDDMGHADTASATANETCAGVYESLMALAERLLDAGAQDQTVVVSLARVRGYKDDLVKVMAQRETLHALEGKVEQLAREREGSLRFALGELNFNRQSAPGKVHTELDFQIAELGKRLGELLSETRAELKRIEDESIELAAQQAVLEDQWEASCKQLREVLGKRIDVLRKDKAAATIVERYEAITSALDMFED